MRNLTIAGNLGSDWQKRSTAAGDVHNSSVAIRAGKDKTLWVKCSAWGKTGQTLAQYTHKGSQICLSGEMDMDTWEKDGKSYSQITLNVRDFTLLGKKEDASPVAQAAQSTQAALTPTPNTEDDIPF